MILDKKGKVSLKNDEKTTNNADSSDTLIFTSLSKEQANNLRAQIINKFPKVWVYVYNLNRKFEVKIASNWGGRIDKSTLEKVQGLVDEFKFESTTAKPNVKEDTKSDPVKS